MKILSVNAGSSSLKFTLFDMPEEKELISGVFEKSCIDENVIHERIPVRSPNYNAFIESYHRYLQDECLTGSIYWNLEHIQNDVADFVYRYNNERIHSSIGYVSPHSYYLKNLLAA